MSSRLTMSKPNLKKSTLALHRMNSRSRDHDGFEEVRQIVKQGSEFSKELMQTLVERAELEAQYSKGLQKLSAKLFKAAKDLNGTVSNAWHFIAEEMDATADVHKTMSGALGEELVRPLKAFVEVQHKTRKAVELSVDKRAKALAEWRAAETKTKIKSYSSCRDNERVQDQALDCKLGRGRVLSDKELMKLESKRKKSEDTVRKSDMEYYACCLKAERARLEWESAVLRGTSIFRQMEEDRLRQLQQLAEQYFQSMQDLRPKLMAALQRLKEPIDQCDVTTDMDTIRKKMEINPESLGEQSLPSFYAEDQVNAMNQERRREALTKFMRLVKSDIEREEKGKAGVENLARALHETPKFGGEDSQQEVHEKLLHMSSMLNFLEACRLKVMNALHDLEGRKRIHHELTQRIEVGRDKNGMAASVLKMPYEQRIVPPVMTAIPEDCGNVMMTSSSMQGPYIRNMLVTSDFTTTVVVSGDDSDFDEFSDGEVAACCSHSSSSSSHSHSSSRSGPVNPAGSIMSATQDGSTYVCATVSETTNELTTTGVMSNSSSSGFVSSNNNVTGMLMTSCCDPADDGEEEHGEKEIGEIYYRHVPSIGQCRAIYDYAANMEDELSIQAGDVINIHDKQSDGWWLGELKGTVGIFPATYVEPHP